MAISLGGILLDGFEVSARITFGGKQALAVHRLPGGLRVVDAMGPDDDAIVWEGILSGGDAAQRARLLDKLRVAGTAVPLAWDEFSATVIVSDLRLDFRNSWWILYQIECTVIIGTQPVGNMPIGMNAISNVIADLSQISEVYDTSNLLALVGATGATAPGSQANATAATALEATQILISNGIANYEDDLGSADFMTVLQAAGSLATLTNASGYLGRALINFGTA